MAHHKHWSERGMSAIKELSGPKGGTTANANDSGYATAQGRHAKGGNVSKAGSFEGPATPQSPPVNSLVGGPIKSQSGGKGTSNGSRLKATIGPLPKNPAGNTTNYKANTVQKLTGSSSRGGKHNGRAG